MLNDKKVIALFDKKLDARNSIIDLEKLNIHKEQITITAKNEVLKDFVDISEDKNPSKGGALGATAGGLIGAISTAIASATITVIPGVNLAVYGTAIAITAGGLGGALISLGASEKNSNFYENQVSNGSVLLVVVANEPDQKERIEDVFKKNNAESITA